jgi:hypothetical protein
MINKDNDIFDFFKEENKNNDTFYKEKNKVANELFDESIRQEENKNEELFNNYNDNNKVVQMNKGVDFDKILSSLGNKNKDKINLYKNDNQINENIYNDKDNYQKNPSFNNIYEQDHKIDKKKNKWNDNKHCKLCRASNKITQLFEMNCHCNYCEKCLKTLVDTCLEGGKRIEMKVDVNGSKFNLKR